MNLTRSPRWSLIITLALVLVGTALPAIGGPKAGSVCKKAQQIRVAGNVSLKCVKIGKRLVWREFRSSPVVVPAVEVTPTPSASPSVSTSPSPTATPTEAAPSDLLNFKHAMIYGVRDSKLIRRADSGIFFEDDSRSKDAFSDVRQRAFSEMNQAGRSTEHPNIEFVYDIRPSFPSFLVDFIKRELSSAAILWNDFFTQKTRVEVSLITEQDQDHIKQDAWIGGNFTPILKRLESRRERPFISGGGIYWNDDRRSVGQVVLATVSSLDLNYINYEWPQVARHEFFHVVQDFALYGESKNRPRSRFVDVQPQHYREGAANTISYLTAFRQLGWSSDAMDWMVWSRARNSRNWMRIDSTDDVIKVMKATESFEPEAAFEMSYAIGALIYEWIIAEYGFQKFTQFVKLIGRRSTLDQALQESIGISKNELYAKSAPYLLSVFERIRPYTD